MTNGPRANRPDPDSIFERDSSFDEALADLVPDLHLRVRLRELASEHAIRQGRYTVMSETEGLLVTEPGLHGIPACIVWLRHEQRTYHRSVIVLKQIALSPPLDDAEDESPA